MSQRKVTVANEVYFVINHLSVTLQNSIHSNTKIGLYRIVNFGTG